MDKIRDFFNSPTGRWVVRAIVVCLGALIQGGDIPGDYVLPGTGITTGQLLPWLATLIPSNKR